MQAGRPPHGVSRAYAVPHLWQARIEALAAKLAGDAPSPKPPARGAERAIVHIDMDCFFASVAGGLMLHDRLAC